MAIKTDFSINNAFVRLANIATTFSEINQKIHDFDNKHGRNFDGRRTLHTKIKSVDFLLRAEPEKVFKLLDTITLSKILTFTKLNPLKPDGNQPDGFIDCLKTNLRPLSDELQSSQSTWSK